MCEKEWIINTPVPLGPAAIFVREDLSLVFFRLLVLLVTFLLKSGIPFLVSSHFLDGTSKGNLIA